MCLHSSGLYVLADALSIVVTTQQSIVLIKDAVWEQELRSRKCCFLMLQQSNKTALEKTIKTDVLSFFLFLSLSLSLSLSLW